ncbi:MAG: hypothetical protein AAGI07_04425 [Bacteroidota bacterium]
MMIEACELQEEKITFDPNIQLSFSTDTVFFDTVFTTVGSITKRFKVFNPSENAIEIEKISIGNIEKSSYSLVINGFESQSLNKTRLLGKDSLLVLVKVFIDPQDSNLPFIIQDSVVFETNGNLQDVKLISWGQDAVFFRGGIQTLPCNSVWDSLRPYVIYDSLLVPEGCTLEMQPGTRVSLAPGASMFIGGTIKINGTLEHPVEISGLRTDIPFDNTPGQWDGIYFLQTSQENTIDWAEIKNGSIGLYLGIPDEDEVPDVILSNSIIKNMALAGIQCISSDLTMYNTLIHSCVENTMLCTAGGSYIFRHNTFAALSREVFREEPSFVLTNFLPINETEALASALDATLENNIIWGRLENELIIEAVEGVGFDLTFSKNILKTTLTDFDNSNIVNENPLFVNEFDNNYRLDSLGESPAVDQGVLLDILTDLDGKQRDDLPDIGAYEYIPEE